MIAAALPSGANQDTAGDYIRTLQVITASFLAGADPSIRSDFRVLSLLAGADHCIVRENGVPGLLAGVNECTIRDNRVLGLRAGTDHGIRDHADCKNQNSESKNSKSSIFAKLHFAKPERIT